MKMKLKLDDGDREDFLPDFKEYMERELKYSQLEISGNPPGYKSYLGKGYGKGIRWVFWNRQDDDLTLSYDHSVDSIPDVCASPKIRLNIRHALHKLISYPELRECLVQFWAPTRTLEGRTLLTTQFQPFALGNTYYTVGRKELCSYRMEMCREYNNSFYADAESGEEQLGLPGRVFLNKLPEYSMGVKHYTLNEYPQRDLALRCKILESWALPVFEQSSHTCVGVLEIAYNHIINKSWADKEFLGRMYDIFQFLGPSMAETRAQEQKRIEDALRQLRETTELLLAKDDKRSSSIDQLKDMVVALTVRMDQNSEKDKLTPAAELIESSKTPPKTPISSSNSVQTRYARIDFPHFSGDDPTGWLYKCERFFEFNHIDEDSKVKLAVMHLDDKAISWFQWFEKNQSTLSWSEFTHGIQMRFGINAFEDPMGELSKLKQVTSVKAYQEKFEELANKTKGLTVEFFISCFLSGLKDEIKAGVQMFQPTTITQAIGLARLQEESIEAMARRSKIFPPPVGQNVSE